MGLLESKRVDRGWDLDTGMHRQRVVNIWPRRSLPRSGRGHAPLDRAAQVAPPRTAPLRLMLGVDGALTQMTPEQPSPVGSNVSHSAIRRLRMVRDMPAPAQPRRSFRCRISAPRPPPAAQMQAVELPGQRYLSAPGFRIPSPKLGAFQSPSTTQHGLRTYCGALG